MDIYYVNSIDFIRIHGKNILGNFANPKDFKSEKRFIQRALGRYLVKNVAKKIYNIENQEIIISDNKPRFKSEEIKFSISHSGNYVAAAFDETECGLDIEQIKPRNIGALSTRYEKIFQSLEDFYKFWTEYEAKIKLHQDPQGIYSTLFQNEYMLTVVSTRTISSQPSCINFLDV